MNIIATCSRSPLEQGKLVGQKTSLRLRVIWAIRVRHSNAEEPGILLSSIWPSTASFEPAT